MSAFETETPSGSRPVAVADRLAALWREVLRVQQVDLDDSFFALGGHSLRAMVLAKRIHEEFGIPVGMEDLLAGGTLRTQARLLVELSPRADPGTHDGPPAIGPAHAAAAPEHLLEDGPRSSPPEDLREALAHGEEQIWFLQRLHPDCPFYNEPFAFRIRGPLDAARLGAALEALVRRHAAFRTSYPEADGRPRRKVALAADSTLQVEEFHASDEQDLAGILGREASRPFAIETGPLVRATLVRLGPDECVFMLTLHHIACDLWTIRMVMRELSDLYAHGVADPGDPPPYGMADHARHEHRASTMQGHAKGMGWWLEHLRGAPDVLDLPADRSRPARATHRGAVLGFQVPAQVVRGVRAFASEQDASLFMTLLSAFQVLLWRYSGQDEVVVGTPIATRKDPRTHGVAGYLLNTLPIRADLGDDPSFVGLLERGRRSLLGAYAHQEVPFEQLVAALAPRRSLSHTPVFQVMFVLQDGAVPAPELAGLEIRPCFVCTGTAKHDLTLFLEESGEALAGRVEYSTDLFEASTIERMIAHFQVLVRGLVLRPGMPVSGHELMEASERDRMLGSWCGRSADYPRDATIHELFRQCARAHPSAPALVEGQGSLTYEELEARAGDQAARLREAGVGRGVRVGIAIPRSAEYVVTVLAVLEAGGTYVPLDPGYPSERLAFMLEDAGIRVVVTDGGGEVERLCRDRGIAVESAGRLPKDGRALRSPPTTGASDAAYVMYTSGSTGTPKGVAIPHRGVVRLVRGVDYAAFGRGTRHLLLAPVAFDASTFELWAPLLNGGCCVVFDERSLELPTLERAIAEQRISCLWLTASLFNTIIDVAPQVLAPVEHILVGGEALSVRHIRKALAALPATRLTNGYGPTECTTFTCTYEIPRGLAADARSVPIGRPLANTRVYVLDRCRRLVPPGIVGELYVGGDGLAQGYINQPGLTAERFPTVDVGGRGPERLYRTGDRCRWLPDGSLEYLGRWDDQVKIRGHRIELGEIEAALGRHPAVSLCAVLATGQDADRQLVAFAKPAPGHSPSEAELRRHLERLLPAPLVPRRIVVSASLPVTPTGKLDRKGLGAVRAQAAAERLAAARNTLEADLQRVWCRVLGLDQVGVHDDFFALGGNSLLAVRLLDRVKTDIGGALPLSRVFAAPTIAEMAEELADRPTFEEGGAIVELRAGGAPPLFVIPGLGGHPIDLKPFAQCLQTDVAVHGLLYPGFDGVAPPAASVAEMAARMLRPIREVQPSGPYRVAGYSLGGLVAYEIAQELVARGEQVELLAVWDTYPGPPDVLPFVKRVRIHLQRLGRASLRGKLAYLGERLARRLGRSGRKRSARPSGRIGADSAWLEANRRLLDASKHAARTYEPRPYPGALLLCRADVRADWEEFLLDDPYQRWTALAMGGVDRHAVPGAHLKLLKLPFVPRLASIMDAALRLGSSQARPLGGERGSRR